MKIKKKKIQFFFSLTFFIINFAKRRRFQESNFLFRAIYLFFRKNEYNYENLDFFDVNQHFFFFDKKKINLHFSEKSRR